MNLESYPFKVGNFECLVIKDDTDVYPVAGSAVNVSTERLEQAMGELGLPANELRIDFNCLLVNTPQRRILVDKDHPPQLFLTFGSLGRERLGSAPKSG